MTDENISSQDAKAALDSIHTSQTAGLARVVPPRWFGIAIALSTGAIMTAAAAGETTLITIGLAGLVSAMAMRRKKAGALPDESPKGAMGIISLILLALFGIALMFGTRVATELYAIAWLPFAAGGVMAFLVYVLSLNERAAYFQRTGGS
jgi:hypothetical protein